MYISSKIIFSFEQSLHKTHIWCTSYGLLNNNPTNICCVRVLLPYSLGAGGGGIAEAVAGAEAQESTVLARGPVPGHGHPLAHQGNVSASSTRSKNGMPTLLLR
jgi:hypothetical protein